MLEQVHESMAPADRKDKGKIEAAIDAFCDQRLASRDDKMVSERERHATPVKQSREILHTKHSSKELGYGNRVAKRTSARLL